MKYILLVFILFSLTLHSCNKREDSVRQKEIVQRQTSIIEKVAKDTISFLNTKDESEEKLRRAYAYLIGKDVVVPNTFEEFQIGMNDKKRRKTLYEYLQKQNVLVPNSYSEFEQALWPVKKQ